MNQYNAEPIEYNGKKYPSIRAAWEDVAKDRSSYTTFHRHYRAENPPKESKQTRPKKEPSEGEKKKPIKIKTTAGWVLPPET